MAGNVILIDRKNRKIGIEEKLKAHREGKLHRAFSIFVFNSKGELLIQRRVKEKYHSGGLWANTACSHPKPNESYSCAVHRRLKEEMGFECKLKKLFCFFYNSLKIMSYIPSDYYAFYLSLSGEYGSLLNRTYIFNLAFISSILGGIIVFLSPGISKKIKEKRGNSEITSKDRVKTTKYIV